LLPDFRELYPEFLAAMAEYSKEEIRKIEEKWRSEWRKRGTYKVSNQSEKPKYYVLDMFPYPSGAGLHVGHPLGYIASDIVSRYKRLRGFNVLHPMGFDSFGLPAEQYAIQTGQHPEKTTRVNIETYKRQLDQIGFCYDWDREVQTTDPKYYKWTQWIFMQLFDSWYSLSTVDGRQSTEGRTERIQTLVNTLEKEGNKNVKAVCDDETPIITAEQWKTLNEQEKENFLQKYRIAYRSETMVNWCPALGTVLSNDEVKDGVSERGGYPVERKEMWQWSMRISAYAERLLTGLDTIDWPDPVREMQRNWIGKSVGCELSFAIENSKSKIDVFTTRIDTIYGVTFMVLAPEHELVAQITTTDKKAEVEKYVEVAKNRSERERMTEVKRITGAFTGAYAINPFNNAKIPVWIADYVLAGYGTGAVMAVPSSDTRDFAFAKHFNLPIINVLEGSTSDITKDNFDPKSGKMINSDSLNGLDWKDAIEKALQQVEQLGIGKRKVNYRMRDAIFGRQRYWGEPFPVYYENGIPKLVELKELPVTLPEINEYKPTETGEPPLGRAINWNHDGLPYELTTMPGWAGSSWYWFRYMDPKNENEFASKDAIKYWKDVDLYIGGSEHATGHLLYSRFWCKALKDLGYVDSEEPFKKLINQGHIQGISKFAHRVNGTNKFVSYNLRKQYETTPLHVDISFVEGDVLDPEKLKGWRDDFKNAEFILEDGKFIVGSEIEKMSKSKHNVVNPDNIVNDYGADTLRMYEMFLGPLEQSKPWNTQGIDGVFKFLRRFWNLFHDATGNFNVSDAEPIKDELKVLHKTLKKIQQDIDNFSFNTSVSEFMICSNELSSMKSNKRALLEPLVIALAPFAPHIAEELWEKLGHKDTIFNATFPKYDEQYLIESSFNYPISINGKVRALMNFALDMPKEDIEKLVVASEIVQKWSEGKPPKKVIIVPGKIVNVVL
jgi:leucyl-tRNA synthetase